MLSFATTIDNIRQRLERRNDVLTLLSKTPFWTLIDAYMQRKLTKVECMKSNYDIVRLIQVYDTKTKKFRFNDGDKENEENDDDSEEENEEEDDAAEEVNEEHDDAAEEENEENDDATEEVNEEHGDAAEEENEEEEDAEVNEEHDDAAEHQVQQHHQLQEDLQTEIPEYRNSTLFEEIVISIP
ncbi:hypothetical protein L3X38_021183 [Prunus dulcis]|uniref:Uncharacterized protein n=1 Tax=Prunus dulcis TaxID=3755 RepID=A0AAD4Z2D1_PRUDU|nr:hypothetical protein L3X38_021183 [Prunus dulcis]